MGASRLGLQALFLNAAGTFGRQIGAALLGLVTIVLISRLYGPEGNGAYALALLMPTMLATFLNLGVPAANVYFLGSGRVSVPEVIRANVRIFASFTLVGLLIGSALLTWHGERLFPDIAPTLLWLALLTFPIALLNSYLHSVFQGLQRFQPFNLLLVGQPLTLLVLVAMLGVTGNRSLTLLIAANVLAQATVLVATMVMIRPLMTPSSGDRPATNYLRRCLDYGWKAHLSNVLTFVSYRADMFLVNLFIGPAAAGLYFIAVTIAEKLGLVSTAVSTVLLPRLSQLESDDALRRQITPLVARWVVAATLLGAALAAIVIAPFIAQVFGAEFAPSSVPLWFLLPGIVFGALSRVLANDLAARGRPELNLYTALAVVAANIAGNVALIPTFGLAGAAVATSVAYAIGMVLRIVIYSRITGTTWFDTVFVKRGDVSLLYAALRHA